MEDEDLETDSPKSMSLYTPWKAFLYNQGAYVSPLPRDEHWPNPFTYDINS